MQLFANRQLSVKEEEEECGSVCPNLFPVNTTAMAAERYLPLYWTLLFAVVCAEQKIITAVHGPDVTLTCQAPNNNIRVVKWSRPDLGDEYVLLYRDGRFEPDDQHPSFKDRVDLQMKDGDVSLILKNVTINDSGTYECRVFTRGTNRRKRANLNSDPISSIYLTVVVPPGQTGGHTEDGGK